MKRSLGILLGIPIVAFFACSSRSDKLFKKIDEGDLSGVKKAVETGADVNECREWGTKKRYRQSPLESALNQNNFNLDIIKYLLDRGARVNERCGTATLLQLAMRPRLTEKTQDPFPVIKLLVDRGYSVNTLDEYGEMPIQQAGTLRIMKYFIEKGAEPCVRNKFGVTTLMNLASSTPDSRKQTGTHEKENVDMISFLAKKCGSINATTNDGWSALRYAVSSGDPVIVKALLDNGANVNAKDNEGKTILMVCAGSENKEFPLGLLLDRGATINDRDAQGRTALIIALNVYNTEYMKLLLSRGADPNIADEDGNTPLFHVSDIKEIDLLLQKGAKPGWKNKKGQTADEYYKDRFNKDVWVELSARVKKARGD